MDNPRFLRIQPHIQLFQYSSRSGQRSTRFSRRLTGDYPIIGNPAIGIAVTHQVLQADSSSYWRSQGRHVGMVELVRTSLGYPATARGCHSK
jgi:hypothetical protein